MLLKCLLPRQKRTSKCVTKRSTQRRTKTSKIMVGITVKIKGIENKAFKKCMMHEIAVCFLHCSFHFVFKIKNYV